MVFSLHLKSQHIPTADTGKLLEEITITSTRTALKLGNVAVPIKIISQRDISKTGSLKLQDILNEQTGITLVNSTLATSLNGYPNPFGQGIQMLGLDPSYTAILIDGEPLVGRNAGILKLGRMATGNIKQIEIVKGPSSSLYGSEAMAGVINIITDYPVSENASLQLHSSANSSFGQTLSYSNKINKTGIQLFGNRYSTRGYDLDPAIYGKTIDPYRDYHLNCKLTHDFSKYTQLLLSIRNFDSKQDNNYQIIWQTQPATVVGYTKEIDRSIFGQFSILLSKKNKIYFRTFYDRYLNSSFVNIDKTAIQFDETSFNQSILKPEIQFESNQKKSRCIVGAGNYFEYIDASRYAGSQRLQTQYLFTQNEWYLFEKKITLISGARLDKRTDYKINLNPRIALAYKPNQKWKITASSGWGFKAPDFRHMYLNFYNAQIGYSLIGANVLGNELQRLQQQGELEPGADISAYINNGQLLPEKSFGSHVGTKYTDEHLTAEVSIYRNDINNLIDVYLLPFKKTNSRNIYSYHNINRIFTQGIEGDIKYILSSKLSFNIGYQYLVAKDKDIIEQINRGTLYKRDPYTFYSSIVSKKDYFGLNNRSRNTFNSKITWENKKQRMLFFIRGVYRGKYGYNDINGNNICDDEREMVKGFWLINVAASKALGNKTNIQLGIENLLDYTNPVQMPNIAGRLFFININYSFYHLFNKN